MKRRKLALFLGSAVLVGLMAATFLVTGPRIKTARPEEILALVPVDLRTAPPPDPVAEARLKRAVELARKPTPAHLDRLSALLDAGPWHVPEGETLQEEIERRLAMRSATRSLTEEMNRIRIRSLEATDQDRVAFGKAALLALRLVDAYDHAGGSFFDVETVGQLSSLVGQAIIETDRSVGLLRADRVAVLRHVPKSLDGEHVAKSVARDFRTYALPRLLKAAQDEEDLKKIFREFTGSPIEYGTYDPLETTRLFVEYARADQLAIRRGLAAVSPALIARSKKMLDEIPTDVPASAGFWPRFRVRWIANHMPNSLGRTWAVPPQVAPVGFLWERRAWNRDRLRNVLQRFSR